MTFSSRLLIIVSLIGTLSFQAFAKPSLGQFQREIEDHIQRVIENSILIYNRYSIIQPQLFPHLRKLDADVRIRLMEVYYGAHDAPKTMTLEELRELGYDGDITILQELHEIYGEAKRPAVIDKLNRAEQIYKARLLRKEFPEIDPVTMNLLIREMQFPENIADYTDAKIKRGPEMGFKAEPFAAYYLFKDIYLDKVAAKISMWLEIVKYNTHNMNTCEKHLRGSSTRSESGSRARGQKNKMTYTLH